MESMATEKLELKCHADGYYRTSWTDESGGRWHRSFGRQKRMAQNAFSRFHSTWQSDWHVRNPGHENQVLTCSGLWEQFKTHAESYYVHPDGSQTGEARNIGYAFSPVLELFDGVAAADFGPKMLKRCRERMIEDDLCLNEVNKRVNKIRQVFKWAASEELVPEGVWVALQTVQSLPAGRQLARESDPVRPVANRWVWAVVGDVTSVVGAMVQLQYWTACRPGEAVLLRPIDLEMTGIDGEQMRVWRWHPPQHKTAWRERQRKRGRKTILVGPQAQAAIQRFLSRPVEAFCFSPLESERERYAECENHRHQVVVEPKTGRRVGDRYTEATYSRAIRYACKRLGVPEWSPNQLRHTALTRLGNQFSDDLARVVAGHAKIDTTEIYLERELTKAAEVMARVG